MRRRFLCACIAVTAFLAGPLLPLSTASPTHSEVTEEGRAQARDALSRLRDLRAQMQQEQLPLEETIREHRTQLEQARQELRKLREAADSNDLALADLEDQVDRLALARTTAETLLTDILSEQAAAVENQLDPDFQNLYAQWENPNNEDPALTLAPPLVERLIESLRESVGGRTAPLTVYSPEGKRMDGTGLFLGPLTFFSNAQQTGIVDISDPAYPKLSPSTIGEAQSIRTVIDARTGLLPMDATGGAALAIRKNSPNLIEEILRAGIWIYPILFAAAVALLVALVKSISLMNARRAVQRGRKRFPAVWKNQDEKAYATFISRQPKPLRPFWETLWNTRTVDPNTRDDLLYARLIDIRLRLTRGLAALSVIAATAPLLGLLGTVTGMITTFQRITLFGTGDPQNLSGGISEALLTTKFGLVVAIPTFLVYAYLSRRAQGTVANLENYSQQFDPTKRTDDISS